MTYVLIVFKEELSRSLPKHASRNTTMIVWIEKEVAASIRAIDPYILIRFTVFAISTTFSNLEL